MLTAVYYVELRLFRTNHAALNRVFLWMLDKAILPKKSYAGGEYQNFLLNKNFLFPCFFNLTYSHMLCKYAAYIF